MTTDKTIKSKNQPKQTNVTWVDLSGKTPVEKHFINGRWVEIGGGSKGSGSGSGTINGIPTIDKNFQPNIVWREPTEEDLAKFTDDSIIRVADLPNGEVPTLLIYKEVGEEEFPPQVHGVSVIRPPFGGSDGQVFIGEGEDAFYLSEDWSLLGISNGVS